jgi:hypothetical protein
VFWSSEVDVGKPASFQLCLVAPTHIQIDALPFSSLSIHLPHREDPMVIKHLDPESSPTLSFQYVDLGHISPSAPLKDVSANLRWQKGGSIVLAGSMSSDVPTSLKVCVSLLVLGKNVSVK